MKHFVITLLALALSALLPAQQTLLQDALAIQASFDTTDAADTDKRLIFNQEPLSADAAKVLRRYLPAKAIISSKSVEDAFKGNPFMRFEGTNQNEIQEFSPTRAELAAADASPVGRSGFSVAGFADGVARFLVKRTKQELSQAFFADFKRAVEKDTFLRIFCPATKQQMLFIDTEVYQFHNYLEGIREAFITDMTALPGNTELYMRDNYADKEAGKISIDLLHLAQQMVDGEPPIDMIDYLASRSSAIQKAKKDELALYNMAGGLRFLNLVSESLRNPESQDSLMPWYTGSEIREIFDDPKVFRLYLGLLWQKSNKISFVNAAGTDPVGMREILGKAGTSADLFESWRKSLESLGEVTHSLQRSLRANAATPTSVSDDFFRYSQSLTNLMQSVNQTGRLVLERKSDLIPEKYIFLMRQSNSLYFNVRQRNYTGAIGNVIYFLDFLNKENHENKGIAKMLKYANFVASIAEANSPDEIEQAIEVFALPPGSSRMKKQPGRFAVALNAYTGLAGGMEYLGSDTSPKGVGAVAAPIGLSCSWGLGRKSKNATDKTKFYDWGSIGFFVPLIDVGAVTAFRFEDSTYQNLPELTWENILSPGLYLVYDVPGKWPMALGLGAQAGPNLRKVSETGLSIDKSGVRVGAFLTVDIPITFFHLGKGK
ncbi:MAG: hypothetical protein ACKVUS_02250 [Saprospiraceae bacterium]